MGNSPSSDSLQSAGFVLARKRPERGEHEFLVLRNATHGSWGFPKGTLDPGEVPREAAWRELAEETGLVPADVHEVKDAEASVDYTVPADTWGPGRPPAPTPKRATYYLAVLDKAAQPPQASDEHDETAWLPLPEAKQRLAPTPPLAELLERLATHLEGTDGG